MERNYDDYDYARGYKTPPPPYSTHWNYEKTAEVQKRHINTKLQTFISALKEHFLNPKTFEEKKEEMQDIWVIHLYEVVRQNREAFDLEPNIYVRHDTNDFMLADICRQNRLNDNAETPTQKREHG